MPAVFCSLTPACFLLALLCVFACLFVVAALSHLTAATAGAVDERAVKSHSTGNAASADAGAEIAAPGLPLGHTERGGVCVLFLLRYITTKSLPLDRVYIMRLRSV